MEAVDTPGEMTQAITVEALSKTKTKKRPLTHILAEKRTSSTGRARKHTHTHTHAHVHLHSEANAFSTVEVRCSQICRGCSNNYPCLQES